MGKIIAVNISEKRGTQKKNIHRGTFIEEFGIENDAHAGKWHRQVSLLSYEKIEEFRKRGAEVGDGAFGENLIVSGFDFKNLPVGTRFRCNDVVLEMTQIGKECHKGCEIFQIMGDCIMPREGVFARVIHGGVISEGDEMVILEENQEKQFTHFDENGNAVMVDVSGKEATERIAVAQGTIVLNREIMQHLMAQTMKKGDVLGVARVAGIMGVKQTPHLIPMCHTILIQKCSIDYEIQEDTCEVTAICTVKTKGETGVEMEALTGVSTTLLTIYDMCKAVDKSMVIKDIHLVSKSGGKSGDFRFGQEQKR